MSLIATTAELRLMLRLEHVQERFLSALKLNLPVSEDLEELLAAVGVGVEVKAAQ